MATTRSTYDDTLAALMGLLNTTVTISAEGAREDDAAVLFMVTGTLTASWDQDLLAANGVDNVAIFRLAGSTFAAFLEREAFREARINANRVKVRLGDTWLDFERGSPASRPAS
jgi:hypothetical protein